MEKNIFSIKKFISLIISLIFVFSIANINISKADFMEDFLNFETELEEIQFEFYSLNNPNLKDSKYQNQYSILNRINPIIKQAIIKQYKDWKFWYYQTNWLITHYNNFIYYSNKYFSSLKNKEIYWNTKEVQSNILKNLRDMKSSYTKFQNLVIKKDMN